MSVPDSTYFGPENITYGDVRNATTSSEKLILLKKRLDSFFIDQIDALDKRSPFPLAIMCCIALETLGAIFADKGDGTQSYRFGFILGKVDSSLSNKLSKKFVAQFKERWPENENMKSRSDLIYSYLRNSLMHGYYARGVYLNDTVGFTWEEGDGYFMINPHWLWQKTKKSYSSMIEEAIKKDCLYRKNAILHVEKMVK